MTGILLSLAVFCMGVTLLLLAACDDQASSHQSAGHAMSLSETKTIKDIDARLDRIEAILRKSQLDTDR